MTEKRERLLFASLLSIGMLAAVMIGPDLCRLALIPEHRYTCEEVLGVPPKIGFYEVIPPGWKGVMSMKLFGDGEVEPVPDFRVWDEKHRLVCDEQGKAVK